MNFILKLLRLLLWPRQTYRKPIDIPAVRRINLRYLDRVPLLKRFAPIVFYRALRRLLPETQRKRHVFCVGKSGSGKSEALKLLALSGKQSQKREKRSGYPRARRDHSFVLIDPHGDLAREMAGQRLYYGDFCACPDDPNLIYIDPYLAAKDGKFPTINPLDISGKSHSDFAIEKIAQQLTRVFQSLVCKGNAEFSVNMEVLLIPCMVVLLKRPRSTLFDLLRFFNDDENRDLLNSGLSSQNAGHQFFFQHSFREKRFNPTKGALSTKIQSLLNTQAFANFLARPQSTIDLEKALNNGKSIIVNCAAGKAGMQTAEAIGRFLVGMILAVAFNRAEQTHASRMPIWLMIDEMQHFVSDEIKIILTEARKYSLHLTLACQVVGQDMTSDLTDIVLGNTAVKMVGNAGAATQRTMAKEMFLKTDDFANLGIGEFIIKSGNRKAARVKLTGALLGRKNMMTAAQWREIEADQLERYYQSVSDRQESCSTSSPATDSPSVSGEVRFGARNPLAELSL